MGLLTEMLQESILNEATNLKPIKTDIPSDWPFSKRWIKEVDEANNLIAEANQMIKLNQIISLSKDVLKVLDKKPELYMNSDVISVIQTLSKKTLDVNIHPSIDKIININPLISFLAKNKQFCDYIKAQKMSFWFHVDEHVRNPYIIFETGPEPDKVSQCIADFNNIGLRLPSNYKFDINSTDEGIIYIRMFYIK